MEIPIEAVNPARLDAEIGRLMNAGPATVAVAGGDGSIRAAAARLAGTGATLVPIPTGTMNHFTRRLGFTGPEAIVDALTNGHVADVPVGIVDHHVFLNTATFGLYADVIRHRERWRPYTGKWLAAALAFAYTIARPRRVGLTAWIEGESIHRTTPLLWVGLGRGSFPRVHLAEDKGAPIDLEIVFLRQRTRWEMIGFLGRFARHLVSPDRPLAERDVERLHARGLLLEARHPIGVTLDGEVITIDPPVFITVQQRALRVLVPAGPPDQRLVQTS